MPSLTWDSRLRGLAGRPRGACEVRGCTRQTLAVGRLCALHSQRLRDKGHATIGRVTVSELIPYRTLAFAFVEAQQAAEHPGVLAGIRYLERWVHDAPAAGNGVARWAAPDVRLNLWLDHARRDFLDVRMVLASGIACVLHEMSFPHRWPDGHHAEFQLGWAVAALLKRKVKSGKLYGEHRAIRKPTGFVLRLARELRGVMLPLFVRAATHLKTTAEQAAEPIPAAVVKVPFRGAGGA